MYKLYYAPGTCALATHIALEEAGVYAIVLEAIPSDIARQITQALSIPTIGIGAGAACEYFEEMSGAFDSSPAKK